MSEPSSRHGRTHRPGLSALEMLVILVLVAFLGMFLLMAVPRGREQARFAACQKNLSQIGVALSLYDQLQRSLPMVAGLDAIGTARDATPSGPLRALLETLGVQDFTGLEPGALAPATGPVLGEIPVAGFVCPSDSNATARIFQAPINYRAVTGSDQHGVDGPFAPGHHTSMAAVEAADGSSFTAGFSERLVGHGKDDVLGTEAYAVAAGPLPRDGCTLFFLKHAGARWYGDAGSTWWSAGYVSTLYNHGLRPNEPLSCLAADGLSAFQGASSGHIRGVNLMMLDGSVRVVLPHIDPEIWKAYATVQSAATAPASAGR